MHRTSADYPPRYLRTPEAARLLSLSPRTMEKHRVHGTGPIYRKLGGRFVYAIADLQAWADAGARRSTFDRSSETILPADQGHKQPSMDG